MFFFLRFTWRSHADHVTSLCSSIVPFPQQLYCICWLWCGKARCEALCAVVPSTAVAGGEGCGDGVAVGLLHDCYLVEPTRCTLSHTSVDQAMHCR